MHAPLHRTSPWTRAARLALVLALASGSAALAGGDPAPADAAISARAATRKPGAPVTLQYRVRPLATGDRVEIALSLTPDVRSGRLSAALSADPGLELEGGAASWSWDLASERPAPMAFRVRPDAGRRYLHVAVSVTNGGRTQRRRFAIPVAGRAEGLAPAELPSPGVRRPSADGGSVISMPAAPGRGR